MTNKPAPVRRRRQPVTEERKQAFLQALTDTASFIEAAHRASPHATGPRGAVSTFKDLCHRDPEFEAQCKEALEAGIAALEAAVYARALHGTKVEESVRPDGTVTTRWNYDVKREALVLGRHSPAWAQIQHSGKQAEINVNLNASASTPTFDVTLLEDLPNAAARQKIREAVLVIEEVEARRALLAQEAVRLGIPQPTIDATLRGGGARALTKTIADHRMNHARLIEAQAVSVVAE